MTKFINRLSLLIAAALIFTLSACGGTPAPTPTVATPAGPGGGPGSVPALSPSATVITAGQLAAVGVTVYANRCSSCHGDQGQGRTAGALIGTSVNLSKYKTGAGLNQSITTTMPINSPGSLSAQDYLSVTIYILLQNNLVKSETPISVGQLDAIKLQ